MISSEAVIQENNARLFLSTQCIKGNIIETIEDLSEITTNIELSGGTQYTPNLLENLINIKENKNISFLMHGYFPPPKEHFVLNFADTREKTRDFIREAIQFVRALGIGYYSIHTGFKRDYEFSNELLINPKGENYSLDSIYENIEWVKKEFPDIKLALENLYPNNLNVDSCFLMHIDEITGILTNRKDIYLLLDLGHLKISSRILNFDYYEAVELIFNKYGDRIMEIHLSENQGEYDDHNLLYSDSVQYMAMRNYAGIIRNYNINMSLEVRNVSLEQLRRCYELLAGILG